MGMSQPSFEQKVAEARRYEMALSEWLQRRFNCYVLPTYDYSGLGESKAPKLYSVEENLVIPDLLAFGPTKTTWVECKWKTRASPHRHSGHLVTGVSRRLFNHYLRVAEVSKCRVYIVFIHDTEGEIRGQQIATLKETIHHEYDGSKMGRHGMVFWEYSKLPLWGRTIELRLAEAG